MKKCLACLKTKANSAFYECERSRDGLRDWCKTCENLDAHLLKQLKKDTQKSHIPKRPYTKKDKESHALLYKRTRNKFLQLYGNKCACCSENKKEFLTIEHVNGRNSSIKESSYQSYRRAIKEHPSSEYEILCMNCNHAKGKYGYCPHATKDSETF